MYIYIHTYVRVYTNIYVHFIEGEIVVQQNLSCIVFGVIGVQGGEDS